MDKFEFRRKQDRLQIRAIRGSLKFGLKSVKKKKKYELIDATNAKTGKDYFIFLL